MTRSSNRSNDAIDAAAELPRLLTRLFARAGRPLLASLLLPACNGAESAVLQESTEALESAMLHCTARGWSPTAALKPAIPVDFVALRRTVAGARPRFAQMDAAGTPCATAKQPRVCEAELARVSLLETTASSSHLVFTHGDTVQALQSLEAKLTLLGAIDTPDEALLMLEHQGNTVVCNLSGQQQIQVRETAQGYRVLIQVPVGCGSRRTLTDVDRAGHVAIVEQRDVRTACPPTPPSAPPSTAGGGGSAAGRRPPNLCASPAPEDDAAPLARYFARVARMEAASVPAFEQLALELRLLGAPRALVEAARHAAEDEVRHARETAAWAEHFGARARTPRLSRTRLRERGELALDNAVEGCVHETYAAYLARLQAKLTHGTALGQTLRGIADDETEHGALAWRIADWIEPSLSAGARRNVAAARTRALGFL